MYEKTNLEKIDKNLSKIGEKIIKYLEEEKNKYKILDDDLKKIKDKEEERKQTIQKNPYESKISTFSEGFLIVKSSEIWGEDVKAFPTSKYDDYLHGVDILLYFPTTKENDSQEKEFNEQRLSGIGVDVTFSGRSLENKLFYFKKNLESIKFITVKYLPNGKIKEIEVPLFVVYLPIKIIEKISKEVKDIEIYNYDLQAIKEVFEEIETQELCYSIYEQLFLQINEWKQKLKQKKLLISEKIQNLKEQEQKTYNRGLRNKIKNKIINYEKIVLELDLMNNLIEFIENHFKIKMDSELNKLTEEEKEKLREKIIENNFVFGHSFLTQIKLNTFDIKELQKPLNADLKKEEVINFLKKNLYL